MKLNCSSELYCAVGHGHKAPEVTRPWSQDSWSWNWRKSGLALMSDTDSLKLQQYATLYPVCHMGGLTSIHGLSVLRVTTRKAALGYTGCLPGQNNGLQISTTHCSLKLGGKMRTEDFLWSFVRGSCRGAAISVQQSLDWMSFAFSFAYGK